MAKKRTPDFGKRGREQTEPGVPKVTVVQRLKTLGARYLHATGLQRKVYPGKGASKPSRPRP
jgi:hypothetical protein